MLAPKRRRALVAQFLGDLCVVALVSDDRRRFGPFAIESRDERMTDAMSQAMAERATASAPPGRSPAAR